MIYLDTSALVKLYLLEDGSEVVNDPVRSQDKALPVWEMQVDTFVTYDGRQRALAEAVGIKVYPAI